MKQKLLLTLILILSFHLNSFSQSEKDLSFDVMMVLDNSGSMKKNDPDFMVENVVSEFIKSLPVNSRVGIVIFSDNSELMLQFTELSQIQTQINIDSLMNKINYTGKYSNIPSAIERAVYELKQNARKDVEKLIIIITDGIVETGNPVNDLERRKWLEEEVALESRDASIKIFGIAFTEDADFMLLQTLSHKTNGVYYRALKSEDIGITLNSINAAINKKIAKQEQPDTIKILEHDSASGLSLELIIGLIVVLMFLGGLVFIFRNRLGILSAAKKDEQIPEAYLLDAECITGKTTYKINKKIFKIGRHQSCDLPITEGDKHLSAFHASIEFRDGSFFLIDQKSINHTYINGRVLDRDEAARLKSGDEVTFFKFRFKFIRADEGEFGETILFNSN